MGAMRWEIEFGGGPEDVLVTSHGEASVEGLHAATSEITAHPRFRPGLWVIFDETDLDYSGMSAADLRRRADLIPSYLAGAGDVRVAVVSPGSVGHGIHRQLEAYAGGFPFDIAVVSTVDEARAWLGPR
jgi:hypothetical protein